MNWEHSYLYMLQDILEDGEERLDRTGIGTLSKFGYTYSVDLKKGFPAVTTKKLQWKAVVSELLWFLEGSTDERRLAEIHYGKPREDLIGKKTIWTDNADNQGKDLGYTNNELVKELGPVYGKQWRNFNGIDQIQSLVDDLKNNPYSRRHLVSAWNVSELDKMALPPCHYSFQFYIGKNGLSCLFNQRSCDSLLGNPFNIASYSLFTHMIASYLNVEVDKVVCNIGDAHIYLNHIDQVEEQLTREPKTPPSLSIPKIESFDIDFIKTLKVGDFKLLNYDNHPAITAPMAI